MRRRAVQTLLLLFVGVGSSATLCVRQARAQVLYGSVTGTVTDQSGAVIPSAQITISNESTSLKRETTSDTSGQFRILDLPEGTYTIMVTATGFQAFKKTGIPVVIGQVNSQDLQLAVGSTAQEVTVQASAVVLQTQKAVVQTAISSYAVSNLPLNTYRNFQSVALLAPGVFSTSGISGNYPNSIADTPERSFNINANGLPPRINTTRVDGATNLFIWLPNHMLIIPPAESIQEVNVQTSNYDVEKGLTAGAATDVITKSGTNQIHGSLYGFNTNNALIARYYFDYTNQKPALNIQNNYGATVGGPIKKDKLFYFFNWDGYWQRQGEFATSLIPPEAYRNGDFSSALGAKLFDANGRPVNVCTTEGQTVQLQQGMVFDPKTGNLSNATGRCVFSSGGNLNVIPTSRMNAGALNYWPLLRQPALTGPITASTAYNDFVTKTADFNREIYTWRLDWNRNDRHTVWGKWTIQTGNYTEPFDYGEAGGNGTGFSHQFAQTGTLGTTWTVTPTHVLTGHLGFTRMSENALPPGFGQPLGQSILGIPGTNQPYGNILYTGLPGISMAGWAGLGSLNSWEPVQRNDWTLTASANLTWIHGKHEFRTGVDIAHKHLNHFQPEILCCPRGYILMGQGNTSINLPANPANPTSGQFMNLYTSSTPSASSFAGTGFSPFLQNSVAAFDIGQIAQTQTSEQYIKATAHDTQTGIYFGDRWRVTPRLTADLGIRWEYFPIITRDGIDKFELYVPFGPGSAQNTMYFGGLGGNPTHLGVHSSKTLFDPRVGLAYQVNEKTVVRAGFGMSNDTMPLERPLRGFYPLTIGAANFVPSSAISSGCDSVPTSASCLFPYATFAQGIPLIQNPDISSGKINPPTDVVIGALAGPGEFKRGYVISWNAFVQRELPLNLIVNVGYVGNHFVHELNGQQINAAPLTGGSAGEPLSLFGRYTQDTFLFQGYLDSNYNGLQISVNRRTSGGLFLQGSYTYSRAMSYTNDNSWENALLYNCPPSSLMPRGCRPLNYGPANFDHTNMFRMAFVYDLPFGAGTKHSSSSKVANAIIGGWQVNGIFTAFSGDPLRITQNVNNIDTPGTSPAPFLVSPAKYIKGNATFNSTTGSFPGLYWFNPTSFVPNTTTNNVGYLTPQLGWLRGPGLWQLDASLFKNFKLSERWSLQIQANALNFFNNPHFSDPGTGGAANGNTCTNYSGQCLGGFGQITGSYGQRIIQFGAFIRF